MPTDVNPAALLASKFINNTNRNIFLTGKAGTGKTTFLKHIIKHTHKNAIIAAPTGIAAINAGGVTIHSLFQLPFGAFVPAHSSGFNNYQNINVNDPSSLMRGLQLSGSKRKLLQEMELLIIDEVSMLRADLLDAIDTVLRSVRRERFVPFGGVQLLFIGDLLQLPPVVKDNEWQVLKEHYKSIFFFDAHALKDQKPLYIELEKIYRQSDNTFISILNNLRNNTVTEKDIEILNSHYKPGFNADTKENYIHLTTHNSKADSINRQAIQKLEGKPHYFYAEVQNEFSEYSYPVEEKLELKKGAQVMFIKNDPTGMQRFFNGKIGKVSNLSNDRIEVSFEDKPHPVTVEKYEWQNIKYAVDAATNHIQENVMGTFTQYPLKLAWAITVHKSQGLTFSKAIIDIGQAFAPGQAYVALSRLTSLDGLILTSPINYKGLSLNDSVTEFGKAKEAQEPLDNILEQEAKVFLNTYIPQCFDFSGLQNTIVQHAASYSKDEQKSNKQKHAEWARQLKQDFEPVKLNGEKFVSQAKQIINSSGNELTKLQQRVIAAKNYFSPILKEHSAAILNHLEQVNKEKKTKKYISELIELDSAFFKHLQLMNKAEALINSAINNSELTKESMGLENNLKERTEQLNQTSVGNDVVKTKRKRGEKSEKAPKINTKEESFKLYKQGKTIPEIAVARSFAITTIEGHLAYYVSLGMIDVKEFVKKEKLQHIIEEAKKQDTTQLSLLKQSLGEGYSYAEIRFALAYYQNAKLAGKEN